MSLTFLHSTLCYYCATSCTNLRILQLYSFIHHPSVLEFYGVFAIGITFGKTGYKPQHVSGLYSYIYFK